MSFSHLPRWKTFFLLFLIALLSACKLFSGNKSGLPDEKVSKNPCVVLALPAGGPAAPMAAKIKRGAGIALEALKKGGVQARLINIDTESPDWLAKLETLPQECAVVGGPLQDKPYIAARQSKAVERRVFFSFVPNLPQGDEGKLAWRFFPSPQDQIESLLNFATQNLNIRSYGAFYPDDNYGRRMTALFEDALARRHMTLEKATYNPASPASWSQAAEGLINPVTGADGKIPLPQTRFEAIFLPDSWKHMDGLTNSLIYNGEDRLVLLGSTLWEQSLSGKPVAKSNKYALAIFPGAWNSARAPKALQGAGNDFWVALGYDFVNFAVNTGIASRVASAEVTARAQRAQNIARAMAPINWNSQGIASQALYLFGVGPGGMKALDEGSLRQARAAINEQAALRMQGIPSEPAQEGSVSESQPAFGATPVQAAPLPSEPVAAPMPASAPAVIGTVPQPSYKLRLPAKRPD